MTGDAWALLSAGEDLLRKGKVGKETISSKEKIYMEVELWKLIPSNLPRPLTYSLVAYGSVHSCLKVSS